MLWEENVNTNDFYIFKFFYLSSPICWQCCPMPSFSWSLSGYQLIHVCFPEPSNFWFTCPLLYDWLTPGGCRQNFNTVNSEGQSEICACSHGQQPLLGHTATFLPSLKFLELAHWLPLFTIHRISALMSG